LDLRRTAVLRRIDKENPKGEENYNLHTELGVYLLPQILAIFLPAVYFLCCLGMNDLFGL
jgi:hypothetical protein